MNDVILQIIDYGSAALTVVSLWLCKKNPNWWAGYMVASMCFTALMIYNWVPGWIIAGVCFIITGARNFCKR